MEPELWLPTTRLRDLHGELAANAGSGGPLGRRSATRLDPRQRYAHQLCRTAQRFDVVDVLRLAELAPGNADALGLECQEAVCK